MDGKFTSEGQSVTFCRLEATATSARTANFWQAAASMRTARWALAVTPFRGRIIVAGGFANGEESLNVVEMFTPPDASSPLGQWTELTGMKQGRAFFTLLTFANAVFALGSALGMHDCPTSALHFFLSLIHALLREAHFMRQKGYSICK
ncbi:unnamed protein product [Schistocephalus solidus]|uniref:Uncharacterized protein n=1 Tax=Schistocephalus solidus TaxID=70667 RepID=A0A183SCG7_SCHSO|nr:unnamed protein product [Schistocephalus solidus]